MILAGNEVCVIGECGKPLIREAERRTVPVSVLGVIQHRVENGVGLARIDAERGFAGNVVVLIEVKVPRVHVHIKEQHIRRDARVVRQCGKHIALAVGRDKYEQQVVLGIDTVIIRLDVGFFVRGQQLRIVDHIAEVIRADEDREGKRQHKGEHRDAESLFYQNRNPPISVCTSVQTNVMPAASPANRPNSLPALSGSSP